MKVAPPPRLTWCHMTPWGQHFHISILGPKNIIWAEKRWNKYKLYIIQNEKVLSFCYELKILWNPSSISYHFCWNSWKLCFKCYVINEYGQNRQNMAKKTIHSFFTYFFPNFERSHDYIWTSLLFTDFGPKCAFLTKNVKKKRKNSILFKMNKC